MLADCLNLLADIDDIQTAVCILIALGERRNDLPIDESIHVGVMFTAPTTTTTTTNPLNFDFDLDFFSLTGILAALLHRFTATASILA